MFHAMILQHARQNPESLAFDSVSQDWSFAQFNRDVGDAVSALAGLRDAELNMVAIHCADLYRHWVFMLALASLGVPSASLPESASPYFLRDLNLLKPDLILSFGGLSLHDFKILEVDNAWVERTRQVAASYISYVLEADSLCRYAIAAGTDAERRVLALTYRQVETAILHVIYQERLLGHFLNDTPHVLSTIGVISLTGFVIGCSALSGGSPLNLVSSGDVGLLIARKIETLAIVSPAHLAHILEVLPPGMAPLPHLKLFVVGGRLNPTLKEKTLKQLTKNVYIAYGADECGAIAIGHVDSLPLVDMVGETLPWVTLEIVDPENRAVMSGEEGVVRLKSSGAVNGYHDEMPNNARHFSDGWFYPGDRAIRTSEGLLRITGRVDDLVSIGGEKFDLSIIDDITRAILNFADLGSFLSVDEGGRSRINIALASAEDFDAELLSQGLRAFYPTLPPVCVMSVDQVPWSIDGRVDRAHLSMSLERSRSGGM